MKLNNSEKGEQNRPATFGGSGFIKRTDHWGSDLGTLWQNWSVCCESDRLTDVCLAWPEDVYKNIKDPNTELLLKKPDINELRAQCSDLIKTYENLGIHVHVLRHSDCTPNWIFQRDTFNSTPKGLVIARPASEQRKTEAVLQFQALAALKGPIVLTIHNNGVFEGADLLWLNSQTALIGTSNRTNTDALVQLRALFPEVTFHEISLPQRAQHLLGIMNFLGTSRIGVWSSQLPKSARKILNKLNIEIIDINHEDEISTQRSLNWVCLEANKILMPHDAPQTARTLNRHGVEIMTANISAYRECGGGLGCLTGILSRSNGKS